MHTFDRALALGAGGPLVRPGWPDWPADWAAAEWISARPI